VLVDVAMVYADNCLVYPDDGMVYITGDFEIIDDGTFSGLDTTGTFLQVSN